LGSGPPLGDRRGLVGYVPQGSGAVLGYMVMRKFLTLLWLLAAVAAVVYHYNGGQRQIRREKAYAQYIQIEKLEQADNPDWEDIIDRYDALSAMLPVDEDPLVLQQIRLAKCRAQLEALELNDAITLLQDLLDEVATQYGENAAISRSVRETMGRAQFMAGWVLQEIGSPENEYRPRFERSRQIFRYLAEHDDAACNKEYKQRIEEAVGAMSDGDG